MSDTKAYRVEYQIAINDQASKQLKKMAETAKLLEAPLNAVKENVSQLEKVLRTFKNSLGDGFVLKPMIDTTLVNKQFEKLEASAKATANFISRVLSKAMSGVNFSTMTKSDEEIMGLLQKRIDNNRSIIESGTNLADDIKKAKKQLETDTQELAKMKKALKEKPATPAKVTNLDRIGAIASKSKDLNSAAKAITTINKGITDLNKSSKAKEIKVDANIAPAVAKINTLLETIRTNVAAIPITVAAADSTGVKGTKAGKAISEKTGKGTKAGKANVAIASQGNVGVIESALQAKEKGKAASAPIVATPKIETAPIIEQVAKLKAQLAEVANNVSVSIKSTFDASTATAQFEKVLVSLQEAANAKPIVLKSALSTNATTANSGVGSPNPTATGANGHGTEQITPTVISGVNKAASDLQDIIKTIAAPLNEVKDDVAKGQKKIADKYKPSLSQINAAERWEEKLFKESLLRRGEVVNLKSAISQRKHAEGQAMYEKLFGGPTKEQIDAWNKHQSQMDEMRMSNNMMSISQQAKRKAKEHAERQAMYEELFGRESAHKQWVSRDKAGLSTRARNIAVREEVARWTQIREAAAKKYVNQRLGNIGYYGNIRGKKALYPRAKQFWYSLTGNTSFGARTPMAIDMAKGMGAMFAIGGAMSAVGSSLNQSIAYQNTMATTRAILQNGTKNYSNEGFHEMENVVRQVGKETKFTAPQVASAAKFLAMAGYDIPAIKEAINPVANIALIGDTNLGETADKLTNVMTTFGINPKDMSRIADIMTSTFTRSNTDMMMLAESAKYAGGIAHLYGGNFQNNFSDVMAMFGVLGNAGIQASSAGTTLRMMYQNLMQPNKNQKATLKKYGINTRDSSGAPLEMADILKQIYAKVPQGQLADAVGNMFRITAQPGAAALIQSIGSGSLLNLIEANRNSAGTGVAQKIADEKKNTLQGLWAQVSSAFTEAILQAVEGRQGGWAGTLAKLRDYLSEPETIETLSHIVDLVENLVTIMGDFARVYAKIYAKFPGIINAWMHFQLIMTQVGYLVTPIIQVLGVLDRLGIGFSALGAAAGITGGINNKQASLAMLAGTAGRYDADIQARQYAAYSAAKDALSNRKIKYGATAGAARMQERINQMKSERFEALRSVRRQNQLLNRGLIDRYAALGGNAALIAQARSQILQRDNAALASGEMSQREYLKYHGFKKTAGMTWKNSFSAGRAMGALSFATLFGGIKSAFISLIGGLAKAVGLLVSPVGLAVVAIGGLITALVMSYKKAKAYDEEMRKNAQRNSELAQKARQTDLKYGNDLVSDFEKGFWGGNKPTVSASSSAPIPNKPKNDIRDSKNKYKDAFGIGDMSVANTKWIGAVLSDRNARLGYNSYAEKKYLGKNLYSDSFENAYGITTKNSETANAVMRLFFPTKYAAIDNQKSADSRARSSLVYRGAIAKSTIDARKKIIELYQQYQSKKIDQDTYYAKTGDILSGAADLSNKLRGEKYNADQIAKSDPTKFYEYQLGAYNAIRAEITGSLGSITGMLDAKQQLENGVTQFSNNWYYAMAHIINGMTASIQTTKGNISVLLKALPNGQIDAQSIIDQVRAKIAQFKLTMTQFANVIAGVYSELVKSGLAKGKYYSDYIRFAIKQTENSEVTAEDAGNYFDTYIAQGDAKATWGGKNRKEYIEYVTNTKNTDEAASERKKIRKRIAVNAAIAAKRNADKMLKSLAPTGDNAKNNYTTNGKTSTSGDNSSDDKKKTQKDYANSYNRNAAKPTQVVINIGNLANFDRTAIAKNSDERAIEEAIETKIAEAVSMLSAQILNTASSAISQGLS